MTRTDDLTERIVRNETELKHFRMDLTALESRFGKLLDKFDDKLNDMPSDRAIVLLIEQGASKAVECHKKDLHTSSGVSIIPRPKVKPVVKVSGIAGGAGAIALVLQFLIERFLLV